MKTLHDFKTLLILLMTGCLYLPSCSDGSVDLDNLNTDILVKVDGIDIPIFSTSEITMDSLVKAYSDPETKLVFDSTDDGTLCIYILGKDITFTMNDPNNALNNGFAQFEQDILFKFDFQLPNVEIPDLGEIPPAEGIIDLNDIIKKPSNGDHDIDKIVFGEGTHINVVSENLGIEPQEITIGGDTYQLNGGECTVPEGKELTVKNGNYSIKFNVTENHVENITFKIHITPTTYVAWGWFDYQFEEDDIKIDSIENLTEDIAQYLENSNFSFFDPQVEFVVKTTGIGIPLVLNLREIISNSEELDDLRISYNINRNVTNDDSKDTTFFYLNRNTSGMDSRYSNLIRSNLSKFEAKYALATDKNSFSDRDPNNMQFISSEGTLSFSAKLILPFWVGDNSYLEYTETIKLDEINFDDFEFSDETELTLNFDYENGLPLSLYGELKLLNENGDTIQFDDPQHKTIEFIQKKDNVNDNGETIKAYKPEKPASITLNYNDANKLKEATHLVVTYRSKKDGNDPTKFRIQTKDKLTVKVSAFLTGGINIKQ
jgi:hypothetical protein